MDTFALRMTVRQQLLFSAIVIKGVNIRVKFSRIALENYFSLIDTG